MPAAVLHFYDEKVFVDKDWYIPEEWKKINEEIKAYHWWLRFILTGRTVGPPLKDIITILGPAECDKRMVQFIEWYFQNIYTNVVSHEN